MESSLFLGGKKNGDSQKHATARRATNTLPYTHAVITRLKVVELVGGPDLLTTLCKNMMQHRKCHSSSFGTTYTRSERVALPTLT